LHSFAFVLKWFEVSFGKPSNFCWRGAGKRGAAGVRRGAGGVQERSGEVQERCRRGAGEEVCIIQYHTCAYHIIPCNPQKTVPKTAQQIHKF
jgi:hypothetical protein